MYRETVWEFQTARFRVALEISSEDMDPADSFEFDEDIETVRNGEVEWFQARVAVYLKDDCKIVLGADTLGGCAYKTIQEFYTSHWRYKHGDYFSDMVSEAVRQARSTLHALGTIKLRA